MKDEKRIDIIKRNFRYDPEIGVVERFQKSNRGRPLADGTKRLIGWHPVTTKLNGYLVTECEGYKLLAHRIAFVLMEGRFPHPTIDHIDHDGMNNKWSNLREATYERNNSNSEKKRYGRRGARFVNNRWYCRFKHEGRDIHLGMYWSEDDAHKAFDNYVKENDLDRELNFPEHKGLHDIKQREKKVAKERSGHTGISIAYNGKFKASVADNGKRKHLGTFESIEEALHAQKQFIENKNA